MTVGVVVKVWDGLVLATDSATTVDLGTGGHQVYNSGNKIFQLHRRLPIAAMTWGLGAIGAASIATLAKDLRSRFMGMDPARADWELDPDHYTVADVAGRLVEHMHGELYSNVFAGQSAPTTGCYFFVAGYSSGARDAEGWTIAITDPSTAPSPVLAIPVGASGWVTYAQSEATERLWWGFDRSALTALQAGLDADEFQKVEAILQASAQVRTPVIGSMPLADAIALGQFMVDVTSGYTHFLMGPNTVGGPTEVASMSRHEGFRWIARKHYYSPQLNPKEVDHAS